MQHAGKRNRKERDDITYLVRVPAGKGKVLCEFAANAGKRPKSLQAAFLEALKEAQSRQEVPHQGQMARMSTLRPLQGFSSREDHGMGGRWNIPVSMPPSFTQCVCSIPRPGVTA